MVFVRRLLFWYNDNMIFSSVSFLFYFFPIVLMFYFLSPRKYRNLILFISSLFFYFVGEKQYTLILLFSCVFNYFYAKRIKDKKSLWFGVIVNLSLLLYFKYINFIVNDVLGFNNLVNIILPIGISFFTFQAISYLVDVYRGTVSASSSFINFGTYLTFFPQLIAGPIVRYETVNEELIDRKESVDDASRGITRFCVGLFKKAVIADTLGSIVKLLSAIKVRSSLSYFLEMISATMQLYYDFSAYSDMAIGMALIFGFHFLENFNYPLIATSVKDFWRRWHISLSSFLKDYIYIPLGGSRCSNSRYIFNLFVVWFITGFWHGADYNFILWGLYFGLVLIIEKFVFKDFFDRHRVIGFVYTALVVNISFVIFNHSNILDVKNFIVGLFNFKYLVDKDTLFYLKNYVVFFIICIVGITPLCKNIYSRLKNKDLVNIILVIILLVVSTAYIIDATFMPFLYFRF